MTIMKYFIAIDYGKARCALAAADKETRIPFGLFECQEKQLFEKLKELSNQYEIEKIILGRNIISEKNGFSKKNQIEKVAEEIKKRFKLDVVFEEEIFSTKIAQRNLLEKKAKQVSKNDNIESARVILESWLDKK